MNYSSDKKKIKIYLGDILEDPGYYIRTVSVLWIFTLYIVGCQIYLWSRLEECREINRKYHTKVTTKFRVLDKIITRSDSNRDVMIFYLEDVKTNKRLTMEDISVSTYLKFKKGDTVFFDVDKSMYDGVKTPIALKPFPCILYAITFIMLQVTYFTFVEDFKENYAFRDFSYILSRTSSLTHDRTRFERKKSIIKRLIYLPYWLGTLVSVIGTIIFWVI